IRPTTLIVSMALATSHATLAAAQSPEQRASDLLQQIQQASGNSDAKTAVADCQRLVTQLDSLPGVHAQKLAAHGALISWANNADYDDLARANVSAVLALVPSLTTDEIKNDQNSQILINAYQTRATHQANDLHADSALQTLADGKKALAAIPTINQAFA